MSTSQLSPQIRNQLQKLAQKDAFAESLNQFVKTAIDILCGTVQQHNQQTCPTALLLAFSHCYCNSIPLSSLASQLPENIRANFIKACENNYNTLQLFNQTGIQQLSNVEWNIDICKGRQLWNIQLKFQSGKSMKLLLNYQQLSVLVFKIGQIIAYAQNYRV